MPSEHILSRYFYPAMSGLKLAILHLIQEKNLMGSEKAKKQGDWVVGWRIYIVL